AEDTDTNTTYTASNGLTLNGTEFELGGTLSRLTTLDLNSNHFTFSGTGNVGIGTTVPGFALEVVGDVKASGTMYASAFSSNSPLYLQTGGTTRLYIDDSNGNVGIGTTAPEFALDITGDARIGGGELYLTGISSSSSTTAGTVYYDSDDNNLYVYDGSGWVDLTTQGSAYTFTNGLTESGGTAKLGGQLSELTTIDLNSNDFAFTGTGNVGIGTTAPGAKLAVSGNILGTGTLTLGSGLTGSEDALYINTGAGFSGNLWKAAINGTTIAQLTSGGVLQVYDSSGTKSLNLSHDGTDAVISSSSGNVNIGSGGGTLYLETDIQNTSANYSGNVQISDNLVVTANTASTLTLLNNTGAGNLFDVQVDGASKLLINNSGNVGIGTTAPEFALDITGDARIGGGELYLTGISSSSSTTAGTVYYDSDDNNLYVYDGSGWVDLTTQGSAYTFTNGLTESGGTAKLGGQLSELTTIDLNSNDFAFTGTGNVGIGTTAPGAKLAVSGNILGTGTLTLGSGLTGSEDALYINTGAGFSGNLWKAAINGTTIAQLTSGGVLQVYDSSGTKSLNLSHDGTDAVISSSSGNVNIGSGGGTLYLETDIQNTSANYSGNVQISDNLVVTANTASTLTLLNNTGAGNLFDVQVDGASKLLINNSGNVGIGTTDPSQTLDVEGTMRLGSLVVGSGDAFYRNATTGDIVNSSSSQRYKKEIEDYEPVLDKLLDLRAVHFTWNELTISDGERDFGMIAEEVAALIPDLVIYNKEGIPEGLRYEKMGLLAIKGLQEQQLQINQLNLGMNATASALTTFDNVALTLDSLTSDVVMLEETVAIIKPEIDTLASEVASHSARLTSLEERLATLEAEQQRTTVSSAFEATVSARLAQLEAKVAEIASNAGILASTLEASVSAGTVAGTTTTVTTPEASSPATITLSQKEIEELKESIVASASTLLAQEIIKGYDSQTHEASISALLAQSFIENIEGDGALPYAVGEEVVFLEKTIFGADTYAYGVTNLAQTNVNGQITIYNAGNPLESLSLTASDISAVGTTLKLQASGLHGIDLLAGKVTIDENGNMDIAGDLRVNGTIIAKEGIVTPALEATGSAVLGKTTVKDHIIVTSDTAGKVTIPAGETEVTVEFAKPYKTAPIVTATQKTPIALGWFRVTDETESGFTIEISTPQTLDVEFAWMAIGLETKSD
ncbi:MAG: tail fiber domain-containing protein, partial [Patescibacteria group bacterium]